MKTKPAATHTPGPLQILTSLTTNGRIGAETLVFALRNKDSIYLKDFILRAVNSHVDIGHVENLLAAVKDYLADLENGTGTLTKERLRNLIAIVEVK